MFLIDALKFIHMNIFWQLSDFLSISINRKRLFEKNGKLSKLKLVLLKRFELNLYASASSFEEYADISTLKERIVAVAKKMYESRYECRETMKWKNGRDFGSCFHGLSFFS